MKRNYLVVFLALVFFAQPHLGYGAGFLIYEHGAAAMAMAGAFVAVANNPSAVWHNPAGIAFLKGTQFSLGTTLIKPSSSLTLGNWPITDARDWQQSSQLYYPSTVYFTQSVGEKLTLGFGFFSPFGLGAKWPVEKGENLFPLRYLGYEDDMKTFFFNPVVAYKLSDKVSVGVGVSYIYSTVKFKLYKLADFTAYGFDVYDVPAELEGSGKSWSFNAGLLYREEKFSFGFNYRSRFDIDYSGDLSLDSSLVPAPLQVYVPEGATGETKFKFPDILGFGVSFSPMEKLLISADAHYVLWSRFDKYVVTFDNPAIEEMEVEEDWKDAWTFRGGVQYMLTPRFALRGGVIYDNTPQPVKSMDPLLPDANRLAFTAGFGYTFGKFVLDFAYQYEKFSERTGPNRDIYLIPIIDLNLGEGTYKTSANLFAFSLSFVF